MNDPWKNKDSLVLKILSQDDAISSTPRGTFWPNSLYSRCSLHCSAQDWGGRGSDTEAVSRGLHWKRSAVRPNPPWVPRVWKNFMPCWVDICDIRRWQGQPSYFRSKDQIIWWAMYMSVSGRCDLKALISISNQFLISLRNFKRLIGLGYSQGIKG